jgi:hypothetical protein
MEFVNYYFELLLSNVSERFFPQGIESYSNLRETILFLYLKEFNFFEFKMLIFKKKFKRIAVIKMYISI